MDSRGSFGCRMLVAVCVVWLVGIVLLRVPGPFDGARLITFFVLGAGLFGFAFLAAIRCRMAV